jgi:hypothetical protein
MNLLDFKYWQKLNEEARSYYTFEIPKRELTELDEAYLDSLNEVIAGIPKSMYDLKVNLPSVIITFHDSKDEVVSSIYGEAQSFAMAFSTPGTSTYFSGNFKVIRDSDIISRGFSRSNLSPKITHLNNSCKIRISIAPEELEKVLSEAANRIILRSERLNVEKIDSSDIIELMYSDGTNLQNLSINLRDKLNNQLRHEALVKTLKRFITSEVSPNIEDTRTNIESRRKNLESTSIEDVISFQRELLDKSDRGNIETDLTTAAMIDNFRVLLKEFGSPKEIKAALDQATE